MSDYSVTDPEVLSFPAVVDGLPDSGVGLIGPNDVRAIWKSGVPRYFQVAVVDYVSGVAPLWAGATEVPVNLPDQAANKKVIGNGFALDSTGAVVYNGNNPMLVTFSLDAAFSQTNGANAVIQLNGSHINALENVKEPLFSTFVSVETKVTGEPNASVVSATSMFTITSGSKISVTRQFVTGDSDTGFTIDSWVMSIKADPLVPATTEIRGGQYGSVSSTSALFSLVPFETLYRAPDSVTFPSGIPAGAYGFTPVVDDYVPNDVLVLVGTSGWAALGPQIYFGTQPAGDSNAVGNEGDYYALGLVSATEVQVYGPKSDGYWPIYPRAVELASLGE
jgi:hypothetical protein